MEAKQPFCTVLIFQIFFFGGLKWNLKMYLSTFAHISSYLCWTPVCLRLKYKYYCINGIWLTVDRGVVFTHSADKPTALKRREDDFIFYILKPTLLLWTTLFYVLCQIYKTYLFYINKIHKYKLMSHRCVNSARRTQFSPKMKASYLFLLLSVCLGHLAAEVMIYTHGLI